MNCYTDYDIVHRLLFASVPKTGGRPISNYSLLNGYLQPALVVYLQLPIMLFPNASSISVDDYCRQRYHVIT